jgi:pimeloyl-ACP methyl ester carboxylesterase
VLRRPLTRPHQIDDFAWHDIPDSITYILGLTRAPSVGYVGFSQGTAQAFAALSIHPQLNAQVNVFIALAPAMAPPGLSAPIVDGLMKSSSVPPLSPDRPCLTPARAARRSCTSCSGARQSSRAHSPGRR